MYRFGICDDNSNFCSDLEKILKESVKEEGIQAELAKFSGGKEFLHFIKSGSTLDLLFLDIEMEGIDGIEISNWIRENPEYDTIQIVYVSGKDKYAMQLFKNHPLDFLIKPVKPENVRQILKSYMRFYEKNPVYFEFSTGKYFRQVLENDIMYFQSEGKKIHITLHQGTNQDFYGKMSEVAKKLKGNKFCTVHKSFIVNLNYVWEFRPKELIMADKTVIPISQSLRKTVQEKILERKMQQNNQA